MKVKTNAKG
jgi:hypothetical protein